MKSLPSLPSDLIDLALADLAVVEQHPKYSICMDAWHAYNPRADICSVCLAGAVMTRTLKAGRTLWKTPADFMGTKNRRALYALDSFRRGQVSCGLSFMDIKSRMRNITVPCYAGREAEFKKTMAGLAKSFRKKGW